MGHIFAEQPEIIPFVVGFALLVASIPYWGDIYAIVSCKKCGSSSKIRSD
jgi:hypothetical protein